MLPPITAETNEAIDIIIFSKLNILIISLEVKPIVKYTPSSLPLYLVNDIVENMMKIIEKIVSKNLFPKDELNKCSWCCDLNYLSPDKSIC